MREPSTTPTLDHTRLARRLRIVRFIRPLQEFSRAETASGLVIITAMVLAMIAANSPLSDSYEDFIGHHISLHLGFFHLDTELKHWVNDGLMVIFFFVVGLEIKREVVAGELSGGRKVWAPIAAAAGGMIVPVIIFLALVEGETARQGWGIPMATDIAIAIGVLTLVGSRVPTGLKVLLLALAIVDDIGAIAVIAIFYTDDINLVALGVADRAARARAAPQLQRHPPRPAVLRDRDLRLDGDARVRGPRDHLRRHPRPDDADEAVVPQRRLHRHR